ncbi:FAD-dependent oxidoreductase [Pseudonocardia halophobica]|uniref:FAD-dependent oxidoreductase n=1 Tax=Pseudonocardia halophobica TaxID=29401 RepID=UPI001E2EBFA3|nr:FAD-dependent oxidoreductase [Pseudonocardia halophobica]
MSRTLPWRRRPQVLVPARPDRPRRVRPGTRAVVVGGGIAGVSAAVVLAERGVAVTLLEAAPTLGGRLGAWPHTLPDGSEQVVEHGFHAFFRHYDTWRSILRRIDPGLGFLRPVEGYPVISRRWPAEDLGNLPAAPPFNLLALFARSPSLRLREIAGADAALGFALLAHDPSATAARFDELSAGEFLARLGVSERARQMLFEAFARSFFCDQDGLSAAELVAMFHYYFLGNPAGIGFDAPAEDHLTAIWVPLAAHLRGLGAEIRTGARVTSLEHAGRAWRVHGVAGPVEAEHVVLALDPGALRTLLAESPIAPDLAQRAAALTVAPPFAVTRLWLDRDVRPERAVFSAVSGEATLDSVTVYSRLEGESARWAARTGGSVVELHSYACRAPDVTSATARMRAELAALWPETAAAGVVHLQERLEATAPAFPPGTAGTRPGVVTDAPGVRVAGDFVECPYPSGLMERAAMTGVLAANDVLAAVGAGPEEIRGIAARGLLAGMPVHRLGRFGRGGPVVPLPDPALR